jgi:Flp pilus assembly protein TadD
VEAFGETPEALKSAPDYAGAHYNLGQALDALGRRDEARAEFEKARGAANH